MPETLAEGSPYSQMQYAISCLQWICIPCLILGNGKQNVALVKGTRARSETAAKPPQPALPSQRVGPELRRSPAQPRGLVEGGCVLLLSLKLSAVSLFKTGRTEVKGLRGEDLQGMETPCWWFDNKCSAIIASPTPLTFWPHSAHYEQGLSCAEFEGLSLTQSLCSGKLPLPSGQVWFNIRAKILGAWP